MVAFEAKMALEACHEEPRERRPHARFGRDWKVLQATEITCQQPSRHCGLKASHSDDEGMTLWTSAIEYVYDKATNSRTSVFGKAVCGPSSVGAQTAGAVSAMRRRCLGHGSPEFTLELHPCYRSKSSAERG